MSIQQRIYPAGRDYSEHGIERGQKISDFAELKVGDVIIEVNHIAHEESAYKVVTVLPLRCSQLGRNLVFPVYYPECGFFYKAIPAQTESQQAVTHEAPALSSPRRALTSQGLVGAYDYKKEEGQG